MVELPKASGHVDISILNTGSFTAEIRKIHQGGGDEKFRLYNWSFAIHHPALGRGVLWDLGLVNEPECYTPFIQKYMFPEIDPLGPADSIAQQIDAVYGWKPEDVDTVIFSHAHFDHCRPCKPIFPNARVFFGPGTAAHCSPGHFQDPAIQWDGRFFDADKCSEDWSELQGPWTSFGPFEHAMDFFGDGSFWVMQAPGHMKGNLCAVARLENGECVLFGGDCCHSRELYLGERDFAVFEINGQAMCLQDDKVSAKQTLQRMREMEKQYGAHVVLAHDSTWLQDGRNPLLLSLMHEKTRRLAEAAIPRGEAF